MFRFIWSLNIFYQVFFSIDDLKTITEYHKQVSLLDSIYRYIMLLKIFGFNWIFFQQIYKKIAVYPSDIMDSMLQAYIVLVWNLDQKMPLERDIFCNSW